MGKSALPSSVASWRNLHRDTGAHAEQKSSALRESLCSFCLLGNRYRVEEKVHTLEMETEGIPKSPSSHSGVIKTTPPKREPSPIPTFTDVVQFSPLFCVQVVL